MLYHNYRRLLDTLDSEIKRYGRSGRSFAVLLNGLKRSTTPMVMLWGGVLSAVWPTLFEFIAVKLTLLLDMKETNFVLVLPETEEEAGR